MLGDTPDTLQANLQPAHEEPLTALSPLAKVTTVRVWGNAMGNTVLALVILGPLVGSAIVPVETPVVPGAQNERWTAVSLVSELRAKDTLDIDGVMAGEEQKTSFEQCLTTDKPELCRVLVGAVNVVVLVGSVFIGP